MNRIALLTLALAAAGASAAALAQDATPEAAHGHHAGASQMHAGKHARRHGHGGGIAMLDANQDGRIARAELNGEDRRAGRLSKQFDAIDANRDGYLVRTEVRAWQQAHRAERQAKRAEKGAARFAAADLNHDGKLSKVEASEKMPRLAKRFAWSDDNRDGYLTREELHPRRR